MSVNRYASEIMAERVEREALERMEEEPTCPHCGTGMAREYSQPAEIDGKVTCPNCKRRH